MDFSAIDVLIAIPLIPLAPVLVTWYLPWESWISREISKSVLGPYFLYASFAAWHFKLTSWIVLAAFVLGAGLSTAAVIERVKKDRKDRNDPSRSEQNKAHR